MSYLSGMLTVGQVTLEMQSREKAGALRELAALVPEIRREPAQLDPFVEALLERERLHTTGIGDGIALPHTRNPLGGILKKPLLVFGRHPKGIPFASVDNKPVQLFFLLAAPSLTEHLKMLATLSRVLRDVNLRASLSSVKKAPEVLQALAEAEQKLFR